MSIKNRIDPEKTRDVVQLFADRKAEIIANETPAETENVSIDAESVTITE
jgi:hypothetical protein